MTPPTPSTPPAHATDNAPQGLSVSRVAAEINLFFGKELAASLREPPPAPTDARERDA